MSIYNLIMISEEELQSAEQGIDFRSLPAASGGQVFREWVAKCCEYFITIHSKKTFQIYKFIFFQFYNQFF